MLKVAMCCPISTVTYGAQLEGVTVAGMPQDTESGNVRSVVLCHQLKAADLISRGATFYIRAEHYLVEEVTLKLIDLIEPQ